MSLRTIWPGARVVIDHIVDEHPEVPDELWLRAWTDGNRIICQACPDAPTPLHV